MIDAALNWIMKLTAQSQLREADRLEAHAEVMRRRAAKLREHASLYVEITGQGGNDRGL